MKQPDRRSVAHSIEVDAPAQTVYDVIADVQDWPHLFPPTIYADRLEHNDTTERIRIWAIANDVVKHWISRRHLVPGQLRIDFQQEVSSPPIVTMSGSWHLEPISTTKSRVVLNHFYVAETPDQLAWIDKTVDHNSQTELAALKQNVEAATAAASLTLSFEDAVHFDGDAQDAFDFVNSAHLWPERLPHVAEVLLEEETPGQQLLSMLTKAPDGSTHTTTSHRVVLDQHTIAYKQISMPALMRVHTGRWTFTNTDAGATASSQHTVVLNEDNITSVLGADAGTDTANAYVRNALSTNSRVTLEHAARYAQDNKGR